MDIVRSPERTERAWAAGFFDGEGSCSINASRSKLHVAISIGQTDPEVLVRFCSAVRLGQVTGPYESPRGHQPIWHYQCTGFDSILTVVGSLWPWLGTVKREQAATTVQTFIRWYRQEYPDYERGLAPGRRSRCPQGHEYTPENTYRYPGRNARACRTCRRDWAVSA